MHPLHQIRPNPQGRLTRLTIQDLKAVFPSHGKDDHEGLRNLREFLLRFDRPKSVLNGIRKLLRLGDPLVAPAETFLRKRAGRQFENWDYPVTLQTLIEPEEGRLLSLPPGSRRLTRYRYIIGDIVNLQIDTRFPRLLAELANRPNLFFPGVYYPRELDVSNMEMISAMHGTFYVVHAQLLVGSRMEEAAVVLKPADMAIESIVTFTLQFLNRRLDPAVRRRIGDILAPTIVAIDDTYGILDLVPGKNGVEFLPKGIKIGTLMELRSNEYPEDLLLSRQEVLEIAREFSKQAAMAYYLRLYDRKPDQLMIHRGPDSVLQFSHIDFGRSLKRNYALPWKRHYDPSRPPLTFEIHEIPYFEAAAAFIYLPHFIPASLRGEMNPFLGVMRETIVETFVDLAREIKSNAGEIKSLFKYLIGRRTQYRPNEVNDICVEPEDVDEVIRSLLTLEDPREIIESILNLAYHEREGTTAIRIEGEDDETGIYRRALLSGERVTALRDKPNGPNPYRLLDYRGRGRVSYDAEEKKLRIEFGDDPERVILHIEQNFSRRLAGYVRQFPGSLRGVELEISSGGDVLVRMKPARGAAGLRRRLNFPQDIMREINESGSGFSPEPHVLAHVAEFKTSAGSGDFLQEETAKHRLILSNDMEGKEILQFVMSAEPEESPLREAMAESIRYLLANPDFLADKDPYESVNPLVISLGRKHLRSQWKTGEAVAWEFLPREMFSAAPAPSMAPAALPPSSRSETNLPVRPILNLYEPAGLSHFVHLILTVRFADELGRRAELPPEEMRLLILSAFLHDLNVLDTSFREVLTEPSGRLSHKILTDILEDHAAISRRVLEKILGGDTRLPQEIREPALLDILERHHVESGGPHGRIRQILHLADNIAVFADRTRPDHWNRGFLRLEEIAPRWIDAQLERSQIERGIWEAAMGFFADPKNHALLRRLDRMSAFYPQCYSALQMAAALHLGLNPQHPNPVRDLRERHGAELVDKIFDNLMKSGLSVRDKIKVINRTDTIAPMLRKVDATAFAFINAGAQPVQRVVELILRFVAERRAVMLMGVLPRVLKTYERFRAAAMDLPAADRERVCAIAGERRLQFVTHSYPLEAQFKMPFHKIIRTWREAKQQHDPCCLIPFERFMESYAPTADPEARVRKLEKASDVEELKSSDRVREEAERYTKWEYAGHGLTFDDRGKERFRRILLGGFTNREVLLFYDETVSEDTAFKKALREVIGALHENPNYLSDRSVYYSIQELVRSLGQIHFYGDTAAGREPLRKFLHNQKLGLAAKLTVLLDTPNPQFNFVKHHISVSLQIGVALGRMWEKSAGREMTAADWKMTVAGTLACGGLLEDGAVADYVLSPEDISSHRALRHLLCGLKPGVAPLIQKRKDLRKLLTSREVERLGRICDSSPLTPEDALPFLLIHTGMMFGSFCDFSKVENWKRGRAQITREDLEFLWEFLSAEIRRIPGGPGAAAFAEFGDVMRKFCVGAGPDLLNRHAASTHSYVRLFNALSLAAELRFGLKARGFDLFHNVRTIYGTNVSEPLIDGIMTADFPPREKVKFARKLRLMAAAATAEPQPPSIVFFVHTDHPLGVAPVRDIRAKFRDGEGPALIIPSGDFDRTEQMFLNLRNRLPVEEFQKLRRRAKFLVGENYPLLIKEKSLQKTDDFQRRIADFRTRRRLPGKYIFVPVAELLHSKPSDETTGVRAHEAAETAGTIHSEKGLFFFRSWMRLFE